MGLINLPKKILSTTWANKPLASVSNNRIIRITDIGFGNNLFISNGTRWMPLGGSCLVAQSNIASTVTGTSAETTLATITVPGGLMSANGMLEIEYLFTHTSAATSRNIRVRFGNGAISVMSSTLTTVSATQGKVFMRNANSVSSQYCQPLGFTSTYGSSTSSIVTYTQDTSINFPITITSTLTDTSQFVTLESYTIFYTEG